MPWVKFRLNCARSGIKLGLSCDRSGVIVRDNFVTSLEGLEEQPAALREFMSEEEGTAILTHEVHRSYWG
jgi:hypothetical protein